MQSLDPDVCIYACMHMCGVYVHQNALNKLESATDGRDVKTEGTPMTNGNADCVWDLTPSLPLFISLLPPAPSVFAPSSSSLGHWGEWTSILILIHLSLCGPLAQRGEWSPGFWNAPPLSSGHWGRVKGRERQRGCRRRGRERRGRDIGEEDVSFLKKKE